MTGRGWVVSSTLPRRGVFGKDMAERVCVYKKLYGLSALTEALFSGKSSAIALTRWESASPEYPAPLGAGPVYKCMKY
jgi:hypothetical protein